MKEEIESIARKIYVYGVYTALVVLKEYQENQEFERCYLLKSAIDKVIETCDYDISSKVDEYSMDNTYENITEDITEKDQYGGNLERYALNLKKHINSL